MRDVGCALADGDSLANITKPSKSATKRQAEHLQKIAKELVGLGPRQLQAVSPVLDAEPELHEAISIAKGINRTNQGRKRQENYIGKLLMTLSVEQQEELDASLNSMRKKPNRA